MKKLLWAAALFFVAPPAEARYSDACFSQGEVAAMVQKRDVLSKAASDCLKKYWDTHKAFFRRNHYSKYFGNRSQSLNTADKRKKILLLKLWPNFPRLLHRDEQAALHAAAGLSDFEKFLQARNPAAFADYQRKIAPLQLDLRASEERGSADVLRPNTNLSLQNISCIDMTRRCLSEGFQAAGMSDTWKKIDHEVLKHDVSGTELQKALSDLGWKILFWNPDPSQNVAFDADEHQANPLPPAPECDPKSAQPCPKAKKWQGSWGDQVYSYKFVEKKDLYPLGGERPIPVDDKKLLVGFGTHPPAEFRHVPFFVGTAHAGYHVFPGFAGQIIEAHSTRALTGFDNLQVSQFNPLAQDKGGGPVWTNSEHYHSGVIAVPPGYLDSSLSLHQPQMDGACVDIHPVPHAAARTSSSTITQ
jgi:hypothetical protein